MGIYIASYIVITFIFIVLKNKTFRICTTSDCHNSKEMQMLLFIIVSCTLLICIIGFRSEFQGIDLHNSLGTGYFYYYEKINEDSWLEILHNYISSHNLNNKRYASFNIGFIFLNKILGTLCDNKQILLFGVSLVSIVPIGIYIYRQSVNPWLSIMLYMAFPFFTSAYFSAIRQGVSIGLVVLSYDFVKNKKLFKFMGMVLLAATIHKSAIICLVVYPIYHLRLSKRESILYGMSTLLLIYVAKVPLFRVLSKILKKSAVISGGGATNLFLLLSVVYVLCAAFCDEKNLKLCGLRNIFWLACASQAFAGLFSTAGRITWYFMPVLMILIPNLLAEARIRERSIVKLAMWIIGFASIFVGLYFLRYNTMALAYPYVPFWVN